MLTEKVTFSLPCLKSLVNSDTSCVSCKSNYKRSLMLLPIHLNDLKQSVREILSSKVTTYDIELGGIILSHKHVKICSSVEMSDEGHFKLDYVADIYIFTPEIGSILSGRINKKGKDVLGCLVHSVFNVALPRPRTEEDNFKKWIGSNVLLGQTVTFSVVKLDFTGRLPYIRGNLIGLETNGADDEGADSGMGYLESNDDDSSMKEINEALSSGVERKLSLKSFKRKVNFDGSLSGSPKAKKTKFPRNSSDEGLSGEESLSTDTLTDGARSNKKNKGLKTEYILNDAARNSENTLNLNEGSLMKESLNIKQGPEEVTAEETITVEKSPKKKKKKGNHSLSSSAITDIKKLSSSLLSEALAEADVKKENVSVEDEVESAKPELSPLYVKKKKNKEGRSSENIDNLTLSLLKEVTANSFTKKSKKVNDDSECSRINIQESLNEPSERKRKEKKRHSDCSSSSSTLQFNIKTDISSTKDNTISVQEVAEGNVSEKKQKTVKNKTSKGGRLSGHSQNYIPEVPDEEKKVELSEKKKRKRHHSQDFNEISSALLKKALNNLPVKEGTVKNDPELSLANDISESDQLPPKKKKSTHSFDMKEVQHNLLQETLQEIQNEKVKKKKVKLSQSTIESMYSRKR